MFDRKSAMWQQAPTGSVGCLDKPFRTKGWHRNAICMGRPDELMKRQKVERRDSHLRRERIVQAAVQLYFSDGYNVALEKIADRALVGRATLYRFFPNRDALTAAVMEVVTEDITDQFRQWGDRDDAFFLCLKVLANLTIASHGLQEMVALRKKPTIREQTTQVFETAIAAPLARAKAAGLVREDLTSLDALLIARMVAVGGLSEQDGNTEAGIEHALRMLMPILAPDKG
jgi:AcrR family transcriptional regulator